MFGCQHGETEVLKEQIERKEQEEERKEQEEEPQKRRPAERRG